MFILTILRIKVQYVIQYRITTGFTKVCRKFAPSEQGFWGSQPPQIENIESIWWKVSLMAPKIISCLRANTWTLSSNATGLQNRTDHKCFSSRGYIYIYIILQIYLLQYRSFIMTFSLLESLQLNTSNQRSTISWRKVCYFCASMDKLPH